MAEPHKVEGCHRCRLLVLMKYDGWADDEDLIILAGAHKIAQINVERQMVENQHRKIKGYRDLTEREIELMNACKETAEKVGLLVVALEAFPDIDKRWLSIAKTDLQKGFMAMIRSVARPESF